MSTLYRLKAYFGMVPAEDLDYADYRDYHDYHDYGDEPYGDRYDDEPRGAHPDLAGGTDSEHRGREHRPSDGSRHRDAGPAEIGTGSSVTGSRSPVVHGALAVSPLPEPLTPPEPAPPAPRAPSATDSSSRALPMSRITTVHPRSYNEARTIGERYREGIPVIINLTELDDEAAKRLVDFAAGLAFALRGSIDKITSRVFLLSPTGVDVSAEDRRKLAERGFFGQD